MSLNIKNERTHALVRQLAELTGQSQTSAVEEAVRQALERELAARDEVQQRAARKVAFEAVLAEIRVDIEPDPTWREHVDAELYDESGLPR